MNIPEKVKINWRTYSVEQGEHRAADNGGNLYGEIVYENNKIFLYEKLDQSEKEVTLLHEIIHGLLYFMGKDDLRNDEAFVTAFSENLYQVIRDNPEVFK